MFTSADGKERGRSGGRDRPGPGLERITVNLSPKGARALESAVKLTGDTKTDTVNRALQIYAYLESLMQDGGTLYVRAEGGGELERLHFV